MEDVKYPLYTKLAACFQLPFAFFSLYWLLRLPEPGLAVTVLGVAGILMAVRADRFARLEKLLWIVIAVALSIVEVRAIRHDRKESAETQQRIQREENQRFEDLLAQERAHFNATVLQSENQFSKTMKQFGENVKTITGGNSFAVVWSPLIPTETANTFPLVLQVRGRYDLQDVHVEVVKLPEPGFGTMEWAKSSLSGRNQNVKGVDIGNVGHRAGKIVPIWVSASDDGGITEYSINVYARNRATHESLRIRKNLTKGEWESSIKVIDGDSHKMLERSKPEWRGFRFLGSR